MSRFEVLPRGQWDPAFAAAVDSLTSPGRAPAALFPPFAHSPRAWAKLSGGSLSDPGPLPIREREIVILRTAAVTGGEFEWTAHKALFAAKAELTPAQVQATFDGSHQSAKWSDAETTLLASVDALLDRKKLTDAEFDQLKAHFDPAQILEIIQLVAFYHGLSLICGALDIGPEADLGRFPNL